MANSSTIDGATGVITVAIAGVTASFTSADFANWGQTILGLAPLLLILFLIWRMHKLDRQHADCQERHGKMQQQLLLLFAASQKTAGNSCKLPSMERFLSNEFELSELDERI